MHSSFARYFVPLFCLALFVPALASARVSDATTGLSATGRAAGLSSACTGSASLCIATVLGRIINIVFGFIGIVLLGYVIYGGFVWMTASGPKEVDHAQAIIRNAVIGVVIMACSFAISGYVLTIAGQLATGGSGSTAGTNGAGGATVDSISDGSARLCCYAGTSPALTCKDDCVRTPTAFGLATGATSDACTLACNSRLCPPSGPVAGQAMCTPGASGGPAPAAFTREAWCATALSAIPPTATCDICVEDCVQRYICDPDPTVRRAVVTSLADVTAQRGACRETVCTRGTSPACTR